MEDPFRNRNNFIEARAKLDAYTYINLMREKSPESLELQPDGEVTIKMVEGREILDYARKKYNLTPQEMMKYSIDLGVAVKEILLRKK